MFSTTRSSLLGIIFEAGVRRYRFHEGVGVQDVVGVLFAVPAMGAARLTFSGNRTAHS
jgi:hypothetical protein